MNDAEQAMAVLVALSGFTRGTPVVFKLNRFGEQKAGDLYGWVGVYERTFMKDGEVWCRVLTTLVNQIGLQWSEYPVDALELLDGLL